MKVPLIISIFFFAIYIDSAYSRRLKRTVITGSANAQATGNNTSSGNSLLGVQTNNGDKGVNYSSNANAGGQTNITIDNQVSGAVDYQNGTYDGSMAAGSVGANGQNSSGTSNINGIVVGPDNYVDSVQQGRGVGVGDTSARMNGSAIVTQDGQVSPFSTENVVVTAGASGSRNSDSEVISQQNVTWGTILADLIDSSVGVGTNVAQANGGFQASNQNGFGVSGNGLMSGTGGDHVNTQVNGNAQIVNDTQDLLMNQYGNAGGDGGASMVGAGQLGTFTGTNKTINTFGDGKSQVDQGSSSIEAIQQSTLNSDNGGQATNHMNVTADASQKNITASDGIQANDQNGPTLVVGGGDLQGYGNRNSTGIVTVDSSYTNPGEAQVVIAGDGTSVTMNGTDRLNISAQGQLLQPNWAANNTGTAMSEGAGMGEKSNDTGSTFLSVDGYGANANTYVDHIGSGANYSDAATRAEVNLNDALAGSRTASSAGNVQAQGQNTSVRSISGMTDYVGMQTSTGLQQSWSAGFGPSQSSSSLVINTPDDGGKRRRKREGALRPSGKPTPDVQDFEIMRICPDSEQTQTGCPLFMKVYDSITGASSWKHMALNDLVQNLYGQPVSSISGKGDETAVTVEKPTTIPAARPSNDQTTNVGSSKAIIYTKGDGVQTISATGEGGILVHSSATLR